MTQRPVAVGAGEKGRHDFKNQLAIIRGFAEVLMAEAADGDPRRRDLAEIHKAAVAALALLAQLFPECGPESATGVRGSIGS